MPGERTPFIIKLEFDIPKLWVKLLKWLQYLFQPHHKLRTEADTTIHNKLQKHGERLRNEAFKAPTVEEAKNLTRRFRKDSNSHLRFIANSKIELANNSAGQILRLEYVFYKNYSSTRDKRAYYLSRYYPDHAGRYKINPS